MLFTDADFITSADLAIVDGEIGKNVIGNVTLGVTFDGPGSVIRRTIEECGSILTAKFQSYGGYALGAGTSAHQYAVNWTGGNYAVNRPRFHLSQVVAIDPDPSKVHVRRWVEYRALAAIFRAVFRRFTAKDYDRYVVKVNDYEQEAGKAASNLWGAGVPVVNVPLDCPGALRQLGAGTFDALAVTHSGVGSADPGSTWFVAVTYTGATYLSALIKGNAESGPSAVQQVTTANGEMVSVSIAGLNPPTGAMLSIGTSGGIFTPMAATGWNIYCGISATAMTLQNVAPLPLTTQSYQLPAAPTTSGAPLQPGQNATSNYSFLNVVSRG